MRLRIWYIFAFLSTGRGGNQDTLDFGQPSSPEIKSVSALETPLGRRLLQGEVRDGQLVVVDYDPARQELTFQAQSALATAQA
jgi:hypothetical protein